MGILCILIDLFILFLDEIIKENKIINPPMRPRNMRTGGQITVMLIAILIVMIIIKKISHRKAGIGLDERHMATLIIASEEYIKIAN